jgi:cell division protein FtsB
MVTHKGYRTSLRVLALYSVAAAFVGYFLYHAQHGSRGMGSKLAVKATLVDARQNLAHLTQERVAWDERVALLKRDSTERDILDERARAVLSRVHKNDIVIMVR